MNGLAWWTPDQWDCLKQISVDPDALDDTYRDWQRNVERLIKRFRREGATVVRVKVDLDELVAWCEEKGKPLNGEARSQYVTEKLWERGHQEQETR